MSGIAWVIFGIVERVLEIDSRILWQRDGFFVTVSSLPVEIPVPDPDQGNGRPVRQMRRHFHILAKIMGMRSDSGELDVARQHNLPFPDLVRSARSNVDVRPEHECVRESSLL